MKSTRKTAIVLIALSIMSPAQADDANLSKGARNFFAQQDASTESTKAGSTIAMGSVVESGSVAASISANAVNNVNFKMVDAAGNGVAGNIFAFSNSGGRAKGPTNSVGEFSTFMPDGTYQSIYFIPTSTESTSVVMTTGTVTAGVLTLNGAVKVGDVWKVTLPIPNLKAKIVHPTTQAIITDAYLDIVKANSNWEDTNEWVTFGNANSSGRLGVSLANGTYLGILGTNGISSSSAGLGSQTYRITVADSGITVALGSTPVTPTEGVFTLSLATANFNAVVKTAAGNVFNQGWADVQKVQGENRNYYAGGSIRNDGSISFSLPDATYEITLSPHTSGAVVATKFTVTVSGGTPSVTGLTAGGDGVWTLVLRTPNVSGTFTTASGPLVINNDQGVSVQLQKKDAYGNWIYTDSYSYSNVNAWGFNLSEQGQYRVIANPNNFDDYVQSYSPDLWVNGSGRIASTNLDLSSAQAASLTYSDSLTSVAIEMKTPNLKLTVVNPLNSDEPVAGGYVELHKFNGNNRYWVSNASINPGNPGIVGFNLEQTGSYVIKVNPPQGNFAIAGLASKEYQVNASDLSNIVVSSGGTPVTVVDGRSVVRLAAANVTARIYRPDGSLATNTNGRWYYVNVQKLNQWNNWDWINLGSHVDQNGYVSFRVDTAGKYRLRMEPYNDPAASMTYSTEFTILAGEESTYEKKFGNLTLNQPTLRVSVASPGAPDVLLQNAGISMMKDGQWYDWANTGNSGVAGITLTAAGNYVFDVHPTENLQSTNTKKSYKFTASLNSDGIVVATPVEAAGASISNGVVKLLLGLPTLTGTVKDPSGATLQANAQVYAQNVQTGQDMWEYSTQTNQNGAWSMFLPAGTYKIYANAPWGSAEYGRSNPVGNVVVNASSVATSVPAGYASDNFVIRLKNPTWSGTIKDPTGTSVVPQGRVCLLVSNVWNCTNANMSGQWALSMSDSFTSFVGTNPLLDINDDYGRAFPMRRFQGETAVSTELGLPGTTGIDLRFKAPNVEITVITPDNTKVASNLWVVAERDNVGYVGSGTTDANGLAKLNISDTSTAFKIRVDVNGNSDIAQNFAPLMQTFSVESITAGTSGGKFAATVQLPTPNFKFAVREPTDIGTAVSYTWVELFSGNDGPWLGGANTDINGLANFKLDAPTSGVTKSYTVIVNPAWNATSNYTRQAYTVTVGANGSIVSVIHKTDKSSKSLTDVNGKLVYPLALGTPSVTGVVVDPSNNAVANSWVVPINAATNEYYWQQGVNSRQDGQLAMNLDTGSYKLEANVPWGSSGVTKSAKCRVTVAEGKISTGGDCVQGTTNKTVRLQLREPNVKFTLKVNGTAIPYANVGVGAGSWWTNVQSDAQGVVSLFIDAQAIREANTWANGSAIRLWFWIDPPYGSSTMARWSCGSTENKPICKDLPDVPANGDYIGRIDLWTVEGMQPNTRLKVVAPGTSTPLPNSWVVVLAMNSSGNKWWLNGGNSGSDGYAAINVETATAFANGYNKLVVEVNAPWNDRTRYATSEYSNNGLGYTFESLTALNSVSPALPNLSIKIKDKNNYENRYGWFGVQEVDASNNYIKWVGGYGLNDLGEGSVYLPASKRFKVTFYPGGGRQGVESTCIFTTDNSTPVVVTKVSCDGTATLSAGLLDLKLAGGNVGGTVLNESGTALAGAVVFAFQPGAASEASAVVSVTDAEGHYDLQLTAGESWNIKVFPPSELSNRLGVKTLSSSFIPSNATVTTKNFSYATP